jgi:hypothetical protein
MTEDVAHCSVEYVYDFGRSLYFRDVSDTALEDVPETAPALDNWQLEVEFLDSRIGGEQGEDREFIPLDKLMSLTSPHIVRNELRSCEDLRELTDDELAKLTSDICEMAAPPAASGDKAAAPSQDKTCRRAIFAILVLLNRTSSISHFVEFGIWDCHLPFRREKREHASRPPYYIMYDNTGRVIPDECFDGWKTCDRETFTNMQWQTLSPYFVFATEEDPTTIRQYDLYDPKRPNAVIFPFLSPTQDGLQEQRLYGAFGEVWQVNIHSAHHNRRLPVSINPVSELQFA